MFYASLNPALKMDNSMARKTFDFLNQRGLLDRSSSGNSIDVIMGAMRRKATIEEELYPIVELVYKNRHLFETSGSSYFDYGSFISVLLVTPPWKEKGIELFEELIEKGDKDTLEIIFSNEYDRNGHLRDFNVFIDGNHHEHSSEINPGRNPLQKILSFKQIKKVLEVFADDHGSIHASYLHSIFNVIRVYNYTWKETVELYDFLKDGQNLEEGMLGYGLLLMAQKGTPKHILESRLYQNSGNDNNFSDGDFSEVYHLLIRPDLVDDSVVEYAYQKDGGIFNPYNTLDDSVVEYAYQKGMEESFNPYNTLVSLLLIEKYGTDPVEKENKMKEILSQDDMNKEAFMFLIHSGSLTSFSLSNKHFIHLMSLISQHRYMKGSIKTKYVNLISKIQNLSAEEKNQILQNLLD